MERDFTQNAGSNAMAKAGIMRNEFWLNFQPVFTNPVIGGQSFFITFIIPDIFNILLSKNPRLAQSSYGC